MTESNVLKRGLGRAALAAATLACAAAMLLRLDAPRKHGR